jgi:ABC-2 type transport system permease protein
MIAIASPRRHFVPLREELAKFPAFFRRDLLIAWSYRTAFLSDWASLLLQTFLFYLIGRMVDPNVLPSYGGSRATYMEFVMVGIAVSAFLSMALVRVSSNIRQEQYAGTLESVLVTPTAPATFQIGSIAYDLVYVPVRTFLFVAFIVVIFGIPLNPAGILPAMLLLLLFIPFVWGLGVLGAASAITVRRGASAVGFLMTVLTIASGAFYPLAVLPGWVREFASANPMTTTIEGMRQELLGSLPASDLLHDVGILVLAGVVSVTFGIAAFRVALSRERRKGTLGLY